MPTTAPALNPIQLAHAYAVCRGIARRAAKNFYFSFLVLPSEKRNAICAVYAFMRHADDITDDASIPYEERRHKLAAWLDEAQKYFAGSIGDGDRSSRSRRSGAGGRARAQRSERKRGRRPPRLKKRL